MSDESNLTRVTVNLNVRAMRALTELIEADGSGKTDAVNRSVVAYSYLQGKVRAGAELKLHYPGGVVEAVMFL
jgi:hypothetical protein